MAKGRLHLDIRQLKGEGLHGLATRSLGGVPLVVYNSTYGDQPLLHVQIAALIQ